MTHHKAVVCVSGGLDSATVLAMASAEFSKCLALSFDYGQRHRHELACAAELCASMGHEHRLIQIDPRIMSGSALTGGGDVPGLNPAIRAATIRANRNGYRVVGLRNGWEGILKIDRKKSLENQLYCQVLTEQNLSLIHI